MTEREGYVYWFILYMLLLHTANTAILICLYLKVVGSIPIWRDH